MTRVAIIGAGAVGLVLADAAVGLVLAAAAAHAGHETVLCDARAPEQVTVIRGESVRVTPVAVSRKPREATPADLGVLAVTWQDSPAVGDWAQLISKDTIVLRAQNGIDAVLDSDSEVLCVVGFGATRLAPGIVLRSSGDRLVVPRDAGALAHFFDAEAVRVEASDAFREEQWRKFAVNVCAGGLTTLFDQGFGVFRDPFVQVIARAVLDEAVAVAAVDGVVLASAFPDEVINDLAGRPVDGTTSMLRDARAGRPPELDAHGAGLVRIASRLHVPAPVNEHLIDTLKAAPRTRYEELVR